MRPGLDGGEAIAQIMTGEVNPSGKLTTTWVRDVGYVGTPVQPYWQFHQISMSPDQGPDGPTGPRGIADFVDGPATALFPFGHGLSYAKFVFSDAVVVATPPEPAAKDDTVTLSVRVTNTGHVAGAAVAQAYCGFLDSHRVRVTRYARMLCSFAKVSLEPKGVATIKLPVTLRTLARWDPDRVSTDLTGAKVRGTYIVDAGRCASA